MVAAVSLAGCAASKPLVRLEQKDIQDAIIERKGDLRECLDAQLRRGPSIHGKVLLRFRILPSCEARDVEAVSEGPAELLGCLTGVIAAVRFPAHSEDAGRITWPLLH